MLIENHKTYFDESCSDKLREKYVKLLSETWSDFEEVDSLDDASIIVVCNDFNRGKNFASKFEDKYIFLAMRKNDIPRARGCDLLWNLFILPTD